MAEDRRDDKARLDDYDDRTVEDLRDLAKERQIDGRSKLDKEGLIDALRGFDQDYNQPTQPQQPFSTQARTVGIGEGRNPADEATRSTPQDVKAAQAEAEAAPAVEAPATDASESP